MTYIEDPEPWVHRWPNNPKEGTRTASEQCTVDGCEATHEPRKSVKLSPEKEDEWWKKALRWKRELLEQLRR